MLCKKISYIFQRAIKCAIKTPSIFFRETIMIKKLTFLSLALGTASAFAMNKDGQGQTLSVTIESLQFTQDFDVQEETTILDLKNVLFSTKKIPIIKQALQPVLPGWITREVGPLLSNDENIKNIMKKYSTDTFALSLTNNENVNVMNRYNINILGTSLALQNQNNMWNGDS